MARLPAQLAGGANVLAFLDMLAAPGVEGTAGHGDDGYNVLVGGDLFACYAEHPRTRVWIPRYKIWSTAAGRYQINAPTWDDLRSRSSLRLTDFSPENQDRAAIALIQMEDAFADVQAGRLARACEKCAPRWASLPGAHYGQREASFATLQAAYTRAGGALA